MFAIDFRTGIGPPVAGLTGGVGACHSGSMQTTNSLVTGLVARLLAVMAVLSLGILPPGVMPEWGATGGIEMVLCSGDGAVVMVMDPATGETRPKPDRTSAKPGCDWAMAQGVADLAPLPFALTAPETATHRAARARANDLWRPAHDPRGLYARGPPALV
jgi:hypothetical protein